MTKTKNEKSTKKKSSEAEDTDIEFGPGHPAFRQPRGGGMPQNHVHDALKAVDDQMIDSKYNTGVRFADRGEQGVGHILAVHQELAGLSMGKSVDVHFVPTTPEHITVHQINVLRDNNFAGAGTIR